MHNHIISRLFAFQNQLKWVGVEFDVNGEYIFIFECDDLLIVEMMEAYSIVQPQNWICKNEITIQWSIFKLKRVKESKWQMI